MSTVTLPRNSTCHKVAHNPLLDDFPVEHLVILPACRKAEARHRKEVEHESGNNGATGTAIV